jgi:hypothetical protein
MITIGNVTLLGVDAQAQPQEKKNPYFIVQYKITDSEYDCEPRPGVKPTEIRFRQNGEWHYAKIIEKYNNENHEEIQ